MVDNEWDDQMRRLDERTAERRLKAKQLDVEVQKEIKEAGERRTDRNPE